MYSVRDGEFWSSAPSPASFTLAELSHGELSSAYDPTWTPWTQQMRKPLQIPVLNTMEGGKEDGEYGFLFKRAEAGHNT